MSLQQGASATDIKIGIRAEKRLGECVTDFRGSYQEADFLCLLRVQSFKAILYNDKFVALRDLSEGAISDLYKQSLAIVLDPKATF